MDIALLSLLQYTENLEMQLAELEILQAMFPGHQEIEVDPDIITRVQEWMEGSEVTFNRLNISHAP